MVAGLVKQVAGTLLDNCAIRMRSAAFSPRAPARGTGEVSEEMDVVSPGARLGYTGAADSLVAPRLWSVQTKWGNEAA